MVIVLALAAAVCNAVSTILERLGVETAPPDAAMRWKLVAHIVRRPIWFLGLLAMIAAFLFQASALSEGGLTLVQPLLVTELLFLVLILRIWFDRPLGWKEAVGCLLTVAGLAVFLAVSDQGGGNTLPGPASWAEVILTCGVGIGGSIALASRGSRAWKSAWYGTAAGITFALCAAFVKSTTTLLSHGGLVFMFEHFEPYAVMVAGASGLFLAQNAYHAGPITASQAALLIVDPIVSIVIGVSLFGDNLRGGVSALTVDALALAVMSVGLYVLSHSPLIASTTSQDRLSRSAPPRGLSEAASSGAATSPQ